MSDADEELIPQQRKKLAVYYNKIVRKQTSFTKMRDENTAGAGNIRMLKSMIGEVEAAKLAYDEIFEIVAGAEIDDAVIAADEEAAMKCSEAVADALTTGQLLVSIRELKRCTQSLELAVTSLNDAYMAEPAKNHSKALAVMEEKLGQLN